MKIKSLVLFLFFAITVSSVSAQGEMFKVLANKGANKVAPSNSSEWKSLMPGTKIFKDQKITIAENGYLGLVHSTGKTIELKAPGIYQVNKLSGEVTAQNSSVTKKYVDYVTGEMTAKDKDMASNRHKYMDVTGSVERGETVAIRALSPKEAMVLNSPVLLKWQGIDSAKAYVVKISNMFDEPVLTMETNENSALVDLGKLNFKKEKVYIWSVSVKDDSKVTSEQYALRYIDEEKASKLNLEIAELKAELKEESALNCMVLASYYEDNKLIINAVEAYENAIRLEPEVEDYQVVYGKFLERNGIIAAKK